MSRQPFEDRDLAQLDELGISVQEAQRQIDLFRAPPPHTVLDRPCVVGDGIVVLDEARHDALLRLHAEVARSGRVSKFVPASGAASRMFKTLLALQNSDEALDRDSLVRRADSGDEAAADGVRLLDEIDRFAFATPSMKRAAHEGDGRTVLDELLSSDGLDYASLPKGLLIFHEYGGERRTPFEEHLVEASEQTRDAEGRCRVHLTVSPDHRRHFEELLTDVRERYERRLESTYDVGFSAQARSTDTIAVDEHDRPFRLEDGSILFRPGGHGALLRNLADLDADIVTIKNIDNVVPDHLKGPTHLWKELLIGYFADVERRSFALQEALVERGDDATVQEARAFVEDELGVPLVERPGGDPRSSLLETLDRPIRVCGVVRNQGEPGGGPFWVRDSDGRVTRQIVEGSQIDPDDEEQQAIRSRATHFNPVDLVCGLRDRHGRTYDLDEYVDPATVFISKKSYEGRELKALERPGLWNGAMAHWLTLFVEVPIETFAPVKTVFDLLRPEHQP